MADNQVIGIVGYGYVGRAMAEFFKTRYGILVYDIDPKYHRDGHVTHNWHPEPGEILNVGTHSEMLNTADIGVICVPTPEANDGSCDTSLVEEACEWVETPFIIIKSTIEPGTTDRLRKKTGKRIVFSPEFCGESTYYSPHGFENDVKKSPWFVFGGYPEDTARVVDFYMTVAGPTKNYIQTTAIAAELTKYVTNVFAATKIVFAYEIHQICKRIGVDYNIVRSLWLNDPRVNPMHTAVFEDNKNCFGGKCLIKDLSSLIQFSKENGYNPDFLEEVATSNRRIGNIRKSQKLRLNQAEQLELFEN